VIRPVRQALWVVVGILAYVLASVAIGVLLAKCAGAADLRRGELEIMARIVQAESTGEPEAGQRAVAMTMLNRLHRPEVFGATLTKVLLAPYQYAKPVPLNDNSGAYLKALLATVKALLGEGGDPSQSATHFYLCSMRPAPGWARRMIKTAQIGSHCFYR
jgi:N-acetylmuramoyl-L-alanine amidase